MCSVERVRSAGIASTVPVNFGKAVGHGKYGALVQLGKCTWYFPASPIVWKIPPALPRSHIECSAAQREALLRSEFAIQRQQYTSNVTIVWSNSSPLLQRALFSFSCRAATATCPIRRAGSRAQARTSRVCSGFHAHQIFVTSLAWGLLLKQGCSSGLLPAGKGACIVPITSG